MSVEEIIVACPEATSWKESTIKCSYSPVQKFVTKKTHFKRVASNVLMQVHKPNVL